MHDYFRIPTVALLSILLIVFLLLYLQNRAKTRLLWLAGWLTVTVRLTIEMLGWPHHGIPFAISNGSMVLASLMFLGSMSPYAFKRTPNLLYVYALAAPILLYSTMASLHPESLGAVRWVLSALLLIDVAVAVFWSIKKPLFSIRFSVGFALLTGAFCLWLTWEGQYVFVLYIVQSLSNFFTALLFLKTYRRLSPGAIFTSLGFVVWCAPLLLDTLFYATRARATIVGGVVNLTKVITAIGMILLVLEDELAQNKVAKERDHRARMELEHYSKLDLSLHSDVHTEAVYQRACEAITKASRFHQAILFLPGIENRFHVAAHSGLTAELVAALEALGSRTTPEQALQFRKSVNVAVEIGNTIQVDLRPLFGRGDKLEELGYLRAHAIPLLTRRGSLDGVFLLSGLKQPAEFLQADDLLPLELLAARLAATRENAALMHRLLRSEKLAGLGQLASGLAHELNNPLTVVLGYSELAEEALAGHPTQHDISVIRNEARRMRQTVEGMLRFWRPSRIEPVSVSIEEILHEIYRLRRPEFDRRKIQLLLQATEDLPQIHANKTQLQQVMMRILQNAFDAFEGVPRTGKAVVRMEASHHAGLVKVVISHSGQEFAHPDRVFDPFYNSGTMKPGTGMGLSVCYAVIRDHGGEIFAHNLQPCGAAVVIDLPAEKSAAVGGELGSAVEH